MFIWKFFFLFFPKISLLYRTINEAVEFCILKSSIIINFMHLHLKLSLEMHQKVGSLGGKIVKNNEITVFPFSFLGKLLSL